MSCGAFLALVVVTPSARLTRREVFRRTVFAPAFSVCLRDLDLLLADLQSSPTHLNDLPARCWVLS